MVAGAVAAVVVVADDASEVLIEAVVDFSVLRWDSSDAGSGAAAEVTNG